MFDLQYWWDCSVLALTTNKYSGVQKWRQDPWKEDKQGELFSLTGCECIGCPPPPPSKPRALKDCMHELPLVYYNTKHAWFTSPIYRDWLSIHFVPEVRHYQENVLRIAPEEAPAQPDVETLVSAGGKMRTMFLPPSTTFIIQPMDLGVIVQWKRFYQRKYLDEVLMVIEEEEDTRGQWTLMNIMTHNIKSAIYNITSAWKDVKIRRDKSVSEMLKTVCRKTIPTMVTKSFLQRKLQNWFRLATNQERVAAVTEWRWWWDQKCLKCEIVSTLSYSMLMRQMTVTFKVFMYASTL